MMSKLRNSKWAMKQELKKADNRPYIVSLSEIAINLANDRRFGLGPWMPLIRN